MHKQNFTGLTVGQINELIEQFGDKCSDYDKVAGTCKVEFDSEEDAQNFLNYYVFASE